MAKLQWDQTGEKLYETGTKKGVLYIPNALGVYANGYAWNGLRSVEESPEGAEPTDLYADDSKYVSLMSAEKFNCTIGAYTYPEEFEQCDGSAALGKGVTIGQQPRKSFGFSYVTTIGNDVESNEYGYKIHLVYGCKATPSSKSYNTINDSPEAIEFSWTVNTTPIEVADHKPTATLVIDSTKISSSKLAEIEALLYGSENTDPKLPTPDEIKAILDKPTQKYTVTVNKTGTGTISIDGVEVTEASVELEAGNHTLTAVAGEGFQITSSTFNGEDITLPYTFDLQAAATVAITFGSLMKKVNNYTK